MEVTVRFCVSVIQIMLNYSLERWWDFRPLFRTRADRYRAWMVILMGAFGQLSGNGLITYFLPVLLRNAGITSQNKQLTLNFVNSVTSFLGALAVSLTIRAPMYRQFIMKALSQPFRALHPSITLADEDSYSYQLDCWWRHCQLSQVF